MIERQPSTSHMPVTSMDNPRRSFTPSKLNRNLSQQTLICPQFPASCQSEFLPRPQPPHLTSGSSSRTSTRTLHLGHGSLLCLTAVAPSHTGWEIDETHLTGGSLGRHTGRSRVRITDPSPRGRRTARMPSGAILTTTARWCHRAGGRTTAASATRANSPAFRG